MGAAVIPIVKTACLEILIPPSAKKLSLLPNEKHCPLRG